MLLCRGVITLPDIAVLQPNLQRDRIMRRFQFALVLFFALVALVAPSASTFAAPARKPNKIVLSAQMQRIVDLVNVRRREVGLRPLSVHPVLMTCAQRYSDVQAAQATISHSGPDGSTPGQRLAACGYRWKHFGENLAAGFVSADEVVNAWMNSPGHKRVILHAKVTEIGLGYAHRDNDPGQYYDYYVMAVGMRK